MQVGSRRESGFTLLLVLGLTAVLGLGLMLAGPAMREQTAREREQQWLRVGNLYALALTQYIEAAPGSLRQGPERLEELLRDNRFVGVRRHLRELYADPLRPGAPWIPVLDSSQRVVGVRSAATGRPFVEPAGYSKGVVASNGGYRYADWLFMARATSAPDARKIASQ
jgi:type II secretory pathway pseudopilin PulG